jgi:hypothetical protein
MTKEGIVESSKATVLESTPVDFSIEVPILGPGELGTSVSTVTLKKDKPRRVKVVTRQGEVVKDWSDEIDPEIVTPLADLPEMQAQLKKQEDEEQKSLLTKAIDGLHRAYAKVHQEIEKVQEEEVRRSYESKVVKFGDDPNTLTDAEYDKYLLQREQDQKLAAYIQKRDREGK